jgi:hypothetical protein
MIWIPVCIISQRERLEASFVVVVKMCGAPNDASNAVSAGNERWKEVERREEAPRG